MKTQFERPILSILRLIPEVIRAIFVLSTRDKRLNTFTGVMQKLIEDSENKIYYAIRKYTNVGNDLTMYVDFYANCDIALTGKKVMYNMNLDIVKYLGNKYETVKGTGQYSACVILKNMDMYYFGKELNAVNKTNVEFVDLSTCGMPRYEDEDVNI